MEKIMSEPGSCDAERITSDELLKRVPTSEYMQEELQNVTKFVQEMREDPRGLAILIGISRRLETQPDALEQLLRNALVTTIQLGNFCIAGGQIVFVDPPEKQEKSNGEG